MGFLWAKQEGPSDCVSETYYAVSGIDDWGKITGTQLTSDRSFGMGCIEWDDVPSRQVFEGALILALHQVVDHFVYPYHYNMPPFITRDLVAFGPTRMGQNYLREFRLVETVIKGVIRRDVRVVPINTGFIRNAGEIARLGVGTQGHVDLWANHMSTGRPQKLLKVS
jgi:hypothetical protein